MTSKERFLLAISHRVPDMVPVTPDISNYIPCRRTGLPFWEIYFTGRVPLWRAYLDAADYYGIDAWIGSCTNAPLIYAPADVERHEELRLDPSREAMRRRAVTRTPYGELTEEFTCFAADPPSPTEKPIKDLARDLPAFFTTRPMPVAIDLPAWNEMRDECTRRGHAFGVCLSYPGFQEWSWYAERGVELLAYAEMDTPALLEEWHAFDLERGTRTMELLIAARPDYILFGGSGTITLASPALARAYALPSLQRWSRMARAAGIPTMLHSCGKSRVLARMLAEETEVDLINPLEVPPMGDVDLREVKAAHGARLALMGNVHTVDVMLRGTPELVREHALAAMRAAAHGGGFVLSTGDQCGRDTPDENLFALVETARRYGRYDARGGLPELPA